MRISTLIAIIPLIAIILVLMVGSCMFRPYGGYYGGYYRPYYHHYYYHPFYRHF